MSAEGVGDFTTEAYDRSADTYLARREERDIWARERKDFASLLKGKRILDAGCGPGIEAGRFADAGFTVTGIDKSAAMLELARKRAPKCEFLQMDMLNLDFPPNSFDGVWCCASLIHLKKKVAGRAIVEFRKAIRKGGAIFISAKEGRGEEVREYPDGTKRFFASYTMGELEALCSANGLRVVKSYRNASDPDREVWLSIFAKPEE